MQMQVQQLSLVIWMIITSAAVPLRGTELQTESIFEKARTAFYLGIEQVEEGKYKEALESFQTSHRLSPKPSVLVNIAMCQKALLRYSAALATFNQYLETADAEAPENSKKVDVVQRAVTELSALVGRIRLGDLPPEAIVSIDDRQHSVSQVAAGLIVDPGHHKIEIQRKGYESIHLDVTVEAGVATTPDFKWQQVKGLLTINCEGGSIFIDEKMVGVCPLSKEMIPGLYQLRIESIGRIPVQRAVLLKADRPTHLNIQLEPLKSEPLQGETIVTKRVDAQQRNNSKLFLLLSVSAASLAVSSGVVGIIFTANGARTHKKAVSIAGRNEGWTSTDRSNYASLLRRASIGLSVGYVMAGLFTATSAAFFWFHHKQKSRFRESIALRWTGMGVFGEF